MHHPAITPRSDLLFHTNRAFFIATVLLISCVIWSPVAAAVISNETAIPAMEEKSPGSLQGEYRHPLMYFTPEQLNSIREHYETASRYNVSHNLRALKGQLPTGSQNLLPYLEYTPSERNQGMCGNCWVWASTGALEIENNIKSGSHDRLSVQYFNSKYNNGGGSSWACCGGWLNQFTAFYAADKTAVPWSNTNANWGDFYSSCGQYVTAVPAGSIGTEPSFTINSISDSSIETRGIGQSAAINNIKSALDENKPVWYAFYLGNNGWNNFENFWWSDSESTIFDPTPYTGEELSAGHAVLIVGYDDTDAEHPYWIVLNSWGTTGNRPNGLFRLNMSMDYNANVLSGGYPYPQHMFSILNADMIQTPAQVVNFTADKTYGSAPLVVQFTDESDVLDPLEYDWDFGDGSHAASQNPLHEYPIRGRYSVTLNITNSTGEYSRTRQNYISVTIPGPIAEFSGTPRYGQSPLTVSFTDASLTDPSIWVWFFGDEDYTAAWTEVNADPGWTNRFGQSSVVLPDGSIVVTGGTDGSTKLDDVWRSTDNGATWTQMAAHAGWSPRSFHTTVAMSDGSIILMGGDDDTDGLYLNDVWRSTDNGATWEEVTASAPWPGRGVHSSVVLADDSIVVMGGNTGFGGGRLNDVWRSTDYGTTWTQMTANAGWSPRWAQSVTVMPDGSMILTAGWNGVYQTDVWRSSDQGATWTEMNSTLAGIERGFHSTAALPDNSILMMGGVNDAGGRNDVWRSTDGGATWALLTDDAAWSDRYYQNSVAMPDGRVIMIGNTVYAGQNDVWQFVPAGSQEQNPVHMYTSPGTYSVALQVMNASGVNSTRKTAYVLVTASGSPANFTADIREGEAPLAVSFSDLSENSPVRWAWSFGDEDYSRSWSLVNGSAGWSPRHFHTGITATDNSILLIGGMDRDMAYLNDIWRSTDNGTTWARIITDAGWLQRMGHSSVIAPDGSILVLGGSVRHDIWKSPDNGTTWSELTADAGWPGRSGQSTVVTPDGSILVMGGFGSSGALNDVWRSTDNGSTWVQMTPDAGWTPRAFFGSAALPDGSIVVAGGYDNSPFHDVWRSTDSGATWTLVNSSPDWDPRGFLSCQAMSDGSILVIGGMGSSTCYNDIWRSADDGATWTLVNAGAGWDPRGYYSAVNSADGNLLIIGGRTNADDVNDVWRLTLSGSSAQNPVHTYTRAGNYTVSLSAYNTFSYSSTSKNDYIKVTQAEIPAPVANFSGTPTSGIAPLAVTFTDESTGDPTGWAWFFGDETYDQPWELVNADPGWSARDMQASVVMPDGTIILMGGKDGAGFKNDVWKSADNGTTWSLVNASAGWSGRQGHSVALMPDGTIVLIGGHAADGSVNDVWQSADRGATWTCVNTSTGWVPRESQAIVVMPDDSIVVTGGSEFGGFTQYNDVWRSDDRGATWNLITNNAAWQQRYGHRMVVMPDGSMVLTGGFTYGPGFWNDTWRSTDAGATWTRVNASGGWAKRYGHTMTEMPDGSIVLIGGSNGTGIHYNDIWRSVDSGSTWTQTIADGGWSSRGWHSSVLMPDSSIIIMGGCKDYKTIHKDIWRFKPAGSMEQNPLHTYSIPGIYPVVLQVSNSGGTNVTQKTGYIKVISGEPEITINPGVPHIINTTIAITGNGATIILNPGRYQEHDIVIGHNVTIRANASAGGNALNTVIDGEYTGRIIDDGAGYFLAVDNLTFRNGNSTDDGGAIRVARGGIVTVTSSAFANCSALMGGAIAAVNYQPCCYPNPVVTVISSTISNCSATANAVYANSASIDIHKCRIFPETGTVIFSVGSGTVNARNNWWGTNDDPSGRVSGTVTTSPWLVLNITATPSTMTSAQTSVIRANLTRNSAGTDTASSGIFVPDYTLVSFWVTSSTGSIDVPYGNISSGTNTTTFTQAGVGRSTVSAFVDDAIVSTDIIVTHGSVTPTMVGVFRPSKSSFLLRPRDYPASRPITTQWGSGTDIPITGDWNGDGSDEIGVFRPSNHKFLLRPADYPVSPGITIDWGTSTDIPVTGDWNGDGSDEVGVFRPSKHKFYLRPADYPVSPGITIDWGTSTDIPVTGNWN